MPRREHERRRSVRSTGPLRESLLPSEIQSSLLGEIRRRLSECAPTRTVQPAARDKRKRRAFWQRGGHKEDTQEGRIFVQIGKRPYQGAVNFPFSFSRESVTGGSRLGDVEETGPLPPQSAGALAYLIQEGRAVGEHIGSNDELAEELGISSITGYGEGMVTLANQISLANRTKPESDSFSQGKQRAENIIREEYIHDLQSWQKNLREHGPSWPWTTQYAKQLRASTGRIQGLRGGMRLFREIEEIL